jgi:hypothetical protein
MKTLLLVVAAMLAAASASAQAMNPVSPNGTLATLQGTAGWRAAAPGPHLNLKPADVEAYALRSAGIARTSVDAKAGAVSGSLGLLCGRQPDVGMSGAAAANGYDPDGKFVGGQVSLKF